MTNINQADLDKWKELNPDLARRNSTPATSLKGQGMAVNPTGVSVSKYRNKRTAYNGIIYDSKAEASKAAELDLLVKAGEIDFYLRQIPFPLPGGIIYRADFVTFEKVELTPYKDSPTYLDGWVIEVIEVKGMPTKEWKMKEKLFREKYPKLVLRVEK
jgi:hypothetical protein